MEVEHFHYKDEYQDEVMEWNNLLPACKRCNGIKSDHDTVVDPIIDPSLVNPKAHLLFWNYRFKAMDDLGKMTISVLDLNDQERLVKKRFEIGNAIHTRLEEINEITDDYISGVQVSARRRNRIVNGLKRLMKEGLPDAIYAATCSTIITTDSEYSTLKVKLIASGLWDVELADLENKLKIIALNLPK